MGDPPAASSPSVPRPSPSATFTDAASGRSSPFRGQPPKLLATHSSSSSTLAEPAVGTTVVHAQGRPLSPTNRPPEFGKMHLFALRLLLNVPVKRPYLILTLGDQVFQTSVSDRATGEWNEGFEFLITYHTQLFGTCQLDLWDSVTLLPDRHIGRAEIKLALLDGLPADFTR
ncbi:hypothetical protein BJ085DRAFT_38981 [Dimargaris cristalligena]|uniref:C2 domain-containing protein n=1 Tax=Dimargaris cristalligena TaxID=215637 RepID=A0A4P9ZJU0_9FUNG|nr:hypothetical protein BJ085DRAFT_38981 [Dimargaris cristalligena]|eukprot:RKP33494.1 hypothetical protein BJ085DRAFT_38981 [Dimargaris cristalligena]